MSLIILLLRGYYNLILDDDISIQTRRKDYSQLQDVNFNESYYCNVGMESDTIYEDHDFTYESDDSYVSVETSDPPLPPQKGLAISFPPRSSYNHLNQPFKTKTSDDTPAAVTKLPQKPQSKMPTNKQMNFFADLSTSLQRYHNDHTDHKYTPVYDDESNNNEDPEYAEARDIGSQRSCLPLMQHYEELPDIGGPQLSETPPPAPPRIMLSPPNPVEKLPSPMKITRNLLTTVPEVTVKIPPSSQNHSREPTLAPSEEYIASSDEMSLGDFVSKYQDEFPVRVRVSRGYYGTSDKWSISEGEYFNVHFIKYTKVVSASDSSFGHYTIPINSSTEFGYLYMPHGNVDAGISVYDFSTVGEILQADRPPVLITAMQTWQKGKSEQNSVNSHDVLLVLGSKGRVKRSLKCLNVKTGKQKLLQQTCGGMFTTRPYETRLFLPEVLKHFTLPAKFVMFINKDENPDLPSDIFSHPVNLSHCSIETSLIATQLDERITKESAPLIEIPMDLDIAVEIVTPKADEVAQLYEETGRLYHTLDIALLQTIPSNIDNLGSDPIAAEALITCHKEHKNVGIEIQQPPRYGIEFGKTSSNLQTREGYSYARSTKENNTKTKVDTENKLCALELNLRRMDSTLRHYTEQMEGQ